MYPNLGGFYPEVLRHPQNHTSALREGKTSGPELELDEVKNVLLLRHLHHPCPPPCAARGAVEQFLRDSRAAARIVGHMTVLRLVCTRVVLVQGALRIAMPALSFRMPSSKTAFAALIRSSGLPFMLVPRASRWTCTSTSRSGRSRTPPARSGPRSPPPSPSLAWSLRLPSCSYPVWPASFSLLACSSNSWLNSFTSSWPCVFLRLLKKSVIYFPTFTTVQLAPTPPHLSRPGCPGQVVVQHQLNLREPPPSAHF